MNESFFMTLKLQYISITVELYKRKKIQHISKQNYPVLPKHRNKRGQPKYRVAFLEIEQTKKKTEKIES